MPYRNLEQRRANDRGARHRRIAQGLCERCSARARQGRTTCEPCGQYDSDRRAAHLRAHGAQPRYADGNGYRERQSETSTRWAACPAHCQKCQGFVVNFSIEYKCVNCGWVGWPEAEVAA